MSLHRVLYDAALSNMQRPEQGREGEQGGGCARRVHCESAGRLSHECSEDVFSAGAGEVGMRNRQLIGRHALTTIPLCTSNRLCYTNAVVLYLAHYHVQSYIVDQSQEPVAHPY